jgi:hypothetical protein
MILRACCRQCVFGVSPMKWRELIRSHQYAEAISDLRRHLAKNPTIWLL